MSKLLQVLTTFLFLGILFTGNTQGYYPMGSRAQSLGNASNTLEDVWAYHHNPAALTGVKKLAVGISYENRFLLKELQSQGVAVALPLKKELFLLEVSVLDTVIFFHLKQGWDIA